MINVPHRDGVHKLINGIVTRSAYPGLVIIQLLQSGGIQVGCRSYHMQDCSTDVIPMF